VIVEKAVKERVKWIISGLDYKKLTDWEERFVEKMESLVDRGFDLTDAQMDKLEEIYREKG